MGIDREAMERMAASFSDDFSRSKFVDTFGRADSIDATFNPYGNQVALQRLTLIGYCAMFCNVDGVRIALDAGANPGAGDPSALQQISGHCREERADDGAIIVGMLIDAGADPNAVSHKGGTALTSLARFAQSPSLARVLLDAGCDPTLGRLDKVEALTKFLERHDLSAAAPGPSLR